MNNKLVILIIIVSMVVSFYVGNLYHTVGPKENPTHEWVAVGTYVMDEGNHRIIYTTDDSIRKHLTSQLPIVDDVFDDNGDHITWFLLDNSISLADVI